MIRRLMSDEEWAFFAPYMIETGPQQGRPPRDHRFVLEGIFWIARTGAPWRDMPDHFGNWSSAYRQFQRWSLTGNWDLLLQALNDTEGVPDGLQMIDSTIVRAHHCAVGATGDKTR